MPPTSALKLLALGVLTQVALAPLAAPLQPPARAKPGGPETVAIQPAQLALSLGEGVFAVSPDMRSVLGFSPAGARLWRVGLGDQGGAKDLRPFGPKLVAYAGQEALALDPQSGKVLGRRPLTLPDPDQPEAGCELAHRDGVCALRCACSFELVRCDTLESIGPKVTLPSLAPVGDTAKARCPSYTGALLGRAGDALIASTPIATDTPFFGVAEEALAVSAASGEVLWRSKGLGRLDPQLSGVTEDRASCFAGSRAGSVQVFDCQRATPRWRRDISIVKTIEPQVFAAGELLIVRDGKTLRGLALADGRERWALPLAQRAVAWPSRGGASALWGGRPDTLVLIEATLGPSDRGHQTSLPLPSGLDTSPLMNEHLVVALGREDL
ncbi:MAG TPA: PQQ-binding-like beta-propeller repeat protein, partial [Myxococcota bacterium]|nr:PQQ-binding-like beta-propeller repeat protein [Myxococcota bacterium]